MIRFQAEVPPVARTRVNHRLNPNEGSYINFFHIYLIHMGSSEILKIHFNLDFFFICDIKHPSLDRIAYKFYKHFFFIQVID